jgi:ASCH domain
MKGLIIDQPWIGLILSGKKTWEIRKTACHHRGRIALIRKGSGQVVGTADIVDSFPPLESASDYARGEALHCIPPERQAQALADGWRTPWVLKNFWQLPRPVSYRHPYGAVIWVNLEEDVSNAVAAQDGQSPRQEGAAINSLTERPQPNPNASNVARPNISPALPGTVRTVTVTGGNLRNHHLYVPLDFFPQDAIGGSNKSESAARAIAVTFIPGTTVETDIDRSKRILRARSPVADFFARAGIQEGDKVAIVSTEPYRYEIAKDTNV